MPTPRRHGGAPIQHFPLNVPAFMGLNKQARGSVLGPEWATRLENTVLDRTNRVSSRKGWDRVTAIADAMGSQIKQLIEFDNAGTFELIATLDNNTIYKSTDNGETWSAVTGTATVTDPGMQLVVFNDVVLGFQDGGVVIKYSGTTFSDLGATGEPNGDVAVAAFGRVWAKDTDTTLKYCALLDETDWSGTDTGTFDLTSVWSGQDEIKALAEFNGALVIFGRRNIIVYADGAGSELGIDPVQAYVVDTVGGIGCIARDTVQNVKGDLWFLDDTGVHSLGRLIQEKSNPINNLSVNVQDELQGYVNSASAASIRAVYSPADRFYLLSLSAGGASTESGVAFCFDTRGVLQDGSIRCAGIWNNFVPSAMVARDNLDLIVALKEKQGAVGKYATYQDDGESYVCEYESGWTDLQTPNLKIMKRLSGLFFLAAAQTVSFKWAFDFDDTFRSQSVQFSQTGVVSEWGEAEWGIGVWGGGILIQEKRVAGGGIGEYIKIGASIEVDGAEFSIQQMAIYAKEGRLR